MQFSLLTSNDRVLIRIFSISIDDSNMLLTYKKDDQNKDKFF